MPIDVDTFAPKVAMDKIRAALREIDQANGYNNRVVVGDHYVPIQDVASDEMPFLCLHPAEVSGGDTASDGADYSQTEINDATLHTAVWCYFEDDYSLEDAMWSLFADITSALYQDESFASTTVATDFDRARWVLPAAQDTNRGMLAVEFRVRLYFPRGG